MIDQDGTSRILKELENTKRELKSSIEDSESRIVSKLNAKIKLLEEENLYLRKSLENLEISNKKKTIFWCLDMKKKLQKIYRSCVKN